MLGAVGLLSSQARSHATIAFGDLYPRLVHTMGRHQFRLFANRNDFPVAFVHWGWLDDVAFDGRLDGADSKTVMDLLAKYPGCRPVCLDMIYLPEHKNLIKQQVEEGLFDSVKPPLVLRWRNGRVHTTAGDML
ncbi:toxin-activating lysine-acyltransferase [Aestuariispira insulae]|uniref:toxin-activating lysine-acyltransferase n=1 Tax=Aestuariispira insulae TaxID=1461337 RepID=UPI0015F28295|nr:toxin-activating lysine-acyltransferase [Aestuariispira insulae]